MEGNEPEAIAHKDNNLKTGQQEVRTSSRILKHPGKMDTFMVNTIVRGCDVKQRSETQVRTGNNLNL